VLAAAPDDPSAWNNLGNAYGGLGKWRDAVDCFGRAASLAPSFSFAAANQALALWQAGDRTEAERRMRALLRRYPDFADVRAALAAALWADGLEAEAEAAWSRVDDARCGLCAAVAVVVDALLWGLCVLHSFP
jgi:tetratricopeptide (TPR) repeat protein